MWTATIQSKAFRNGALEVTVFFSDGADTFTEVYSSANGDINSQIQKRLNILSVAVTMAAQVSPGLFAPKPSMISVALPSVISEFTTFQDNLQQLETVSELVSLGVLSQSSSIYTAALASVQGSLTSSVLGQL